MFKSTEVILETPLEIGEKRQVIFEITGDPKEIVFVKPDCGCTAEAEIKDNTLVAMYSENISDSIFTEYKNGQEPRKKSVEEVKLLYPSGYADFIKSITVFFNDDQNLMIPDGVNMKYNDGKKQQRIFFKGKVKLF